MAGIKCFNNDFIWTGDLGDLARSSIADSSREQRSVPTHRIIFSSSPRRETLTLALRGEELQGVQTGGLEGKFWVLGAAGPKR